MSAEVQADDIQLRDRAELQRLDARIEARLRRDQPVDRLLARRVALVERSLAGIAQRTARALRMDVPADLPIAEHAGEILEALAAHQVVVVAGETGSGKTTQLPRLLLRAGYGRRGRIGHTQPRRLAARNVAARLAEELGVAVGEEVGFRTRFEQALGDACRVKLMTDGILLAETAGDPDLLAYDAIIIDEAHERSLNIDFLLGYLHRLRERRPELKIVITSATIDEERFARHFASGDIPAPVINVSGRTYPVALDYLPMDDWGDAEGGEVGLAQGVRAALVEIRRREQQGSGAGVGDVLVFLPGEREIRDVAHSLRDGVEGLDFEVLPLYARLSSGDQQRVFQPGGRRRVVLATNVAETSLTVPRIGYVIDSGLARISRYSYRSKLQRLPVEPISRASAAQRAGRCGRLAPGVCLRLYEEAEFEARDAFTEPEILRTNLAAVVLQMKVLGLGDPEDFPFMQPPDPRALSDGRRLLIELQALDGDGRLTDSGRTLARLPLDPRLGRMLLAGAELDCLAEVMVIVSGLTVADPRERPADKGAAADQAHAEFVDPGSDFMGLLRLWRWLEAQREELSSSAFRRLCGRRFLSFNRVREWRALHRQLHLLGRELGWRERAESADPDRVHQALLAGLLSMVGCRTERGDYLGARGSRFHVFPGSALFRRSPPWVMAAEIVETSRVYARTLAGIQPDWLEQAATHLVRRQHEAPRWHRRRGRVLAAERVTLFGLVLAEGRLVPFDHIDPQGAREIFLRDALARGDIDSRGPFLEHNRRLMEQVRDIEARQRRRDLLLGEDALAALYAERVPTEIVSARAFERWRRKVERDDPQLLFFGLDDLLAARPEAGVEEDYPGRLVLGELECELRYSFAPGAEDDGVTLRVPRLGLAQLRPEPLQWLVPGLLEAKVTALLRTLPKRLRRALTPIPDRVAEILPELLAADTYRRGHLLGALTNVLQQRYRLDVPADAWRTMDLEAHLLMRIEVLDESGRPCGSGRDLLALQRELDVDGADAIGSSDAGSAFERQGVTAWDFGALPERVLLEGGVAAYPALVDAGDGVDLRLQSTPEVARVLSRGGLLRLLVLAQRSNLRHLLKGLRSRQRLELLHAPHGETARLLDALALIAAGDAHLGGARPGDDDAAWRTELPRDAQAFRQLLDQGRARLAAALDAVAALVLRILQAHHDLRVAIDAAGSPAFADAVDDVRGQVERLLPPDFLLHTPRDRLQDLPRYLEAAAWRLQHLQGAVDRDRSRIAELAGWQDQLVALQTLRDADAVASAVAQAPWPSGDDAVQRCRWLLEEYRVSLFAQQLGTREPVSPKRLRTLYRQAGEALRLAVG